MKKSSALLCSFAGIAAAAQVPQPNVILLMTDDMGWGDVGFNGNEIIKTPNLDALSSRGIVFNRFYTGCAVSSPTRASVLTGRSPFRTGVFNANVGILRPEENTIAEMLQQRGYMTGHFGKWHLGTLTCTSEDANRGRKGNTREFNIPAEHGYIESFVTESKVPTWDPCFKPINSKPLASGDTTRHEFGTHYWHNGVIETENLRGDDSRVIMDRVLPFIARSKEADRPFLSVIWFHAPHLPVVAGPEYKAMYAQYTEHEQNYYGCITAMDEQVGRLVAYLRAEGLYDNTIICFCSDNGPERKTAGNTGNHRGRKRNLTDGGIRVPGFMVWDGHISPGQRTEHVAFTSDYLPTIADVLDIDCGSRHLDGESLLPFLERGAARQKPVVVTLQNTGTVIEQQYKLLYLNGTCKLYDMRKDTTESCDLSAQRPEIVSRMMKYLDDRLSDFQASFEGQEYGRRSYDRMGQEWHDIKAVENGEMVVPAHGRRDKKK